MDCRPLRLDAAEPYEATQRQRKFERTIRKQKRRILVDESIEDAEKLQVDQIKLQRLKQEYARFSKGVGLPMQHARMETAGFTWKHGKAAENAARQAEKGVAKSKKSGTMNTKAIGKKVSQRGEVINPMSREEYSRIRASLEAKGIHIVAATGGDDLAYLLRIGAEGTYSNGWLSHIGEIPSKGTLFEELIHMAQAKKYGELDSSDYVELFAREIEANRKLLRCKDAYKLDALDVADIERNLQSWEKAFERRTGTSYDESNYRKNV